MKHFAILILAIVSLSACARTLSNDATIFDYKGKRYLVIYETSTVTQFSGTRTKDSAIEALAVQGTNGDWISLPNTSLGYTVESGDVVRRVHSSLIETTPEGRFQIATKNLQSQKEASSDDDEY